MPFLAGKQGCFARAFWEKYACISFFFGIFFAGKNRQKEEIFRRFFGKNALVFPPGVWYTTFKVCKCAPVQPWKGNGCMQNKDFDLEERRV